MHGWLPNSSVPDLPPLVFQISSQLSLLSLVESHHLQLNSTTPLLFGALISFRLSRFAFSFYFSTSTILLRGEVSYRDHLYEHEHRPNHSHRPLTPRDIRRERTPTLGHLSSCFTHALHTEFQ